MKFFIKKNIFALFSAALLLSLIGSKLTNFYAAEKKEAQAVSIDIRILATGDLHGQATAYNYETGERYDAVGLSKLATLINNSRDELGISNTILVDAGDILYDYSTNYIYENHPDVIQPIMQVMSALNYDCITLGNHDFDYTWTYLNNQLIGSGLYDKTTVCNIYDEQSMEHIFAPSIIVERKAVGSDGDTHTVKIAVIGATRNGFSTRRDYYGFLSSDEIYTSVLTEAKRIREEGSADIIVALIHGGTGILSGANTDTHPGARLAKSEYIDAVISSHSHEEFPSITGKYSSSLIADETTGLVYGTPLVATGAHAKALGVIDISISLNKDNTYSISSASSSLRYVTEDLIETKLCNRIFNQYMLEMTASRDATKYPIAEGITYTNLGCFIKDNALFQLYNNAKLEYAYSYVAENTPEYSDIPVIAATANFLDSSYDYISISDYFDEAAVAKIIAESSFMRDSGYIHIYKITGKKLKEWLEFNASFYATAETEIIELLPKFYTKKPNAYQLVNSNYLNDYSSFFIFDGINYEIDISKPPRYNSSGKLIASSRHRISTAKYNGVEITDEQEFLIVMDSLNTRYAFMPEDSESIFSTLPWYNGKQIFLDYLEEISKLGPISITADDNWHVKPPYTSYSFVIGMPKGIRDSIKNEAWYVSYADYNMLYNHFPIFYYGKYPSVSSMQRKLSMTLSVDKKLPTAMDVTITAHINRTYYKRIAKIEYLKGAYPKDSPFWDNAAACGYNITVSENGIYSVRVTDTAGNSYVSCVEISNIDKSIVDIPRVMTFTNRIDELKGYSIPGSTVIAADNNNHYYSTTALEDGSFVINLPYQNAFTTLKVYAVYENNVSDDAIVLVKKTGPNQPVVNQMLAGTKTIKGTTDPYTTLYVRIGNTVYAAEKDFELIKSSEFYKSSYTIKKATISIDKNNNFNIKLPVNLKANGTYCVYAVNIKGKTSKSFNQKPD